MVIDNQTNETLKALGASVKHHVNEAIRVYLRFKVCSELTGKPISSHADVAADNYLNDYLPIYEARAGKK